MAIRTVFLEPTLVRLRRPFDIYARGTGDQRQPITTSTGEPIWVAEAMVAGLLPSPFIDLARGLEDRPDTLRIRVVGGTCPTFATGAVLRLEGATATTWYAPRERGSAARSDVTITPANITVATDLPPTRGGLVARFPLEIPATLCAQNDAGLCDVMFDPIGVYTVEGLAEVHVAQPLAPELFGQHVAPLGLRAYYIAPDPADVSARQRSQLVLVAAGFAPVPPASNGRRAARPDTDPAEAVQ